MSEAITPAIVERSQAMYRLVREGDPAWLDVIDVAVEWHAPQTPIGGGLLHGHTELLAFMQEVGNHFDDVSVDPEEFLPSGETLMVLGTWRGTDKSSGEEVQTPFAHAQRFRDGKLVYMRVYMNTATVDSS